MPKFYFRKIFALNLQIQDQKHFLMPKTRFQLISLLLILFSLGFMIPAKHPGWKLVWSDEFNYNGLPDSAKWNYDTGGNGWGNNELEYYTAKRPENARV